MKLGIVGLPNVGKSTLFNAITKAGAQSANYPFCTIEPNVGIVDVPDERLDVLAKMYNPEKVTPAFIEFVDIAGLVRGASRGEGLGNKFLSHIREVDAIIHVVRCFDDDNIVHVDGGIDPVRDIETINLELVFADLEMIEKRYEKVAKLVKTGEKKYAQEAEVLGRIKKILEDGMPARSAELSEEEALLIRDMNLLTDKKIIYAANMSEDDIADSAENEYYKKVADYAAKEGSSVMPIAAKIEEEIASLDDDERAMYLEEMGVGASGLDNLVAKSYDLLGLISYLTAGPKEVRAWTIKRGTRAPQAAGKIHSDFERGFIRAEVVSYKDLTECGSSLAAKEKGLVRSEGKDYVMQDGDVVVFRFNV